MKIIKSDSVTAAPAIFTVVKSAFNRDFDLETHNVQEVEDYIQNSDIWLVKKDTTLVAYYVVRQNSESEYELRSIAVHSDFQKQGIGKLLMADLLQKYGHKKIILVTHPKNLGALLLYLKNGFIIYGYNPDYYGDGEPRIELSREGK